MNLKYIFAKEEQLFFLRLLLQTLEIKTLLIVFSAIQKVVIFLSSINKIKRAIDEAIHYGKVEVAYENIKDENGKIGIPPAD